jgi:hypothetical protein
MFEIIPVPSLDVWGDLVQVPLQGRVPVTILPPSVG